MPTPVNNTTGVEELDVLQDIMRDSSHFDAGDMDLASLMSEMSLPTFTGIPASTMPAANSSSQEPSNLEQISPAAPPMWEIREETQSTSPTGTITRQPGTRQASSRPAAPTVNQPAASVTSRSGLGRARHRVTTCPPPGSQSTMSYPQTKPEITSSVTHKPGGQLKKMIGDKFPQLNSKEINKYLKYVKETSSGEAMTVDRAFKRAIELIELDYPPVSPSSGLPSEKPVSCVICHEALNTKHVLGLECGHSFHRDCVDQWFATQNHTCPTCRAHQPPPDEYPPLN